MGDSSEVTRRVASTSVNMAASVNDPADPTSDYMWGLGSLYPLAVPASAATSTTVVPSTCDNTGNNPGGTGNTSPCIDNFGNVTATIQQSSTDAGSSTSQS